MLETFKFLYTKIKVLPKLNKLTKKVLLSGIVMHRVVIQRELLFKFRGNEFVNIVSGRDSILSHAEGI